jgi:iron complex outermembrane recepter protein
MKFNLRHRLMTSTLIIGAAAFANPALAQDGALPQGETADVGDPAERFCIDNPTDPQCVGPGAIIVTGSRIPRPDLVSASPLQIIDAQDIDASGAINVQQVLLENPTTGAPTISRTNSNFFTSSVGVATVDLRNLGSDRTLVLVNGRRFVAGVPSSATVDLNSIPTQFIERIDILTGGQSSIYGSDALAGVVNIIYKTGFQGIEASGQIGISEEGDDLRRQANLLMGADVAGGRGNVMLHLGYSNEGAIFSRDRARSAVDQISCAYFTGESADLFTPCRPFYSGFAPQGTFYAGNGVFTFDPGTGAIRSPNTNCVTGVPFEPIPGCVPTGFNRSAFRTIAVPTERYLMALSGTYEVANNINWFTEGTFAYTRTTSQLEPFALASDDIFAATAGDFPIETRLPDGTIVRNPFVPDAIYNAAEDWTGDGLRDIYFTRRMSDFGNRGNTANRTTFRIMTGLNGSVFNNWNWEAYYSYGETGESQRGTGQVNVLNFANALAAIPGPNGTVICASEAARAQGCVPINVFGANTASPEAVAYIEAPQMRNTRTTQQLAGANIAGNLVQFLPAGPIGFALGTEYRKEFSEENNDVLTEQGLNAGNAIPSSRGQFDVIDGYGELVVPLIRDSFIHDLTLNGAARISHYSTVGTAFSYNAGIEFSPVQDIRFRGVYARATRAPNIGELFTPPSQTYPTGLVDPCLGVTATSTGALAANCRADPGVAANIAANGAFTLNQADIQGVSGFNRGNPDLDVEKADSITVGVVINPRSISWLRNFALTVDYFDIKIKDAIVFTPRQFILDQCYGQGQQEFCQFITRRASGTGQNSPGSLEFIDSGPTNSGGLETEGVDATLSYRSRLDALGLGFLGGGMFNARVSYTHMLKGFVIPLIGSDPDHYVGEVGAPKDRVFGIVSYDEDKWGLSFRGSWIGPVRLDNTFMESFGFDADDPNGRVGSEFYAGVQFRFRPRDQFEFFAGADNLLNNEPPRIITGLPGNDTGVETFSGHYDPIGRRFYAGARLRF